MTKDNLYTAIGKINDRYLKDVLKEESESFQNTHSSDLSVNCERTIVMDVVRKKKKISSLQITGLICPSGHADIISPIHSPDP